MPLDFSPFLSLSKLLQAMNFDRIEVHYVSTATLAGVEQNTALGSDVIADHGKSYTINDLITLAEVAEGEGVDSGDWGALAG
jgi:hypothetical protein